MEKSKHIEELVDLSFLVDVGKAIVAAKTMKEILNRVMEKVGAVFAPLNWSLILYDPVSDEMIFKLAVGEAADKLTGKRFPASQGISGWILKNGQSVIVTDVSKDNRFSDQVDRMTGFKTESIIGVPLKTENKVLGIIELINKLDGKPFTAFELKALTIIADFAAIALEKAFYIRTIRKISLTDHLTGLYNRRNFDRVLELEVEKCKRYKTPLSMLMADINKFKEINDRYGHPAGDKVLQHCAQLFMNNVRKVDMVARYGGDEFAVIMPNTDRKDAEQVKLRILEDLHDISGDGIPEYSVTIGLHSYSGTGECDLLRKSDIDLYHKKQKKADLSLGDNFLQYLQDEEAEEQDSG